MRNTWIVLTRTGAVLLALVVGTMALSVVIPEGRAMDLLGQGARMHGDADHARLHAECVDETSTAMPHNRTHERSECPYSPDRHPMMGRMMHGDGHHAHRFTGGRDDCRWFDQNDETERSR